MIHVLYIVYWGATEPLGQAVTLPLVKRLAKTNAKIILITFEKSSDLEKTEAMDEIQKKFKEWGIQWFPLRYHKSPQLLAKTWDILNGVFQSLRILASQKVSIIHAQTMMGVVIGTLVSWISSAKLVYQKESYYAREKIEGGYWKAGSLRDRVVRLWEKIILSQTDAMTVLTERDLAFTKKYMAKRLSRDIPLALVRVGVDLDRFSPTLIQPRIDQKTFRFVYNGSVGGRYLIQKLGEFVGESFRIDNGVRLKFLSKAPQETILRYLKPSGLPQEVVSVQNLDPFQMGKTIVLQHVGLCFLKQGFATRMCSPTKIPEYLACGLPIVMTANIGDFDQIIHREKIGVIVREHSQKCYIDTFLELKELLKDEDLSQRCRRISEIYFDVQLGCDSLHQLYGKIL